MRRREFIALVVGSAAVAWPLATRAQQPAMPVVAMINGGSPDGSAGRAASAKASTKPATSTASHWLEGQYDRLPALMADLVRRQVAVIATPANTPAALAAKAATTTIPIV